MKQIIDIYALRKQVLSWKQADDKIAFVPTMGNLHEGHLSLVKKAKELSDKVIVSIFVNPLQFDDKADLSAYPRTLENDISLLKTVDCDAAFLPTAEIMYPEGMKNHSLITVPNMDDKLCGQVRPGHFDGVATVVTKLFNMVQADIAVFGEKDYQQLLLIKKVVADLNLPIEIQSASTFREKNGLAMSSRNQYLTAEQRQQASALYRILTEMQTQLEQGDRNFIRLQDKAKQELEQLGFEPDYVDIRHAKNLEPAKQSDKALRILLAARLGKARLIDNIACNLD